MGVFNSCTREFVGTGSFVVSRAASLVLQAVLGSCVGVAMWDRRAGVGGLIHLLLPEQVGGDGPFRSSLYARTGIPILIEALEQAGASRERLEASLAGGALVGQVSEIDLRLDVGGRTTDMARRMLAAEGIPVRMSETGGYLGCRMLFDLRNFTTSIEPTFEAKETPPEAMPPLTRESIEEAVRSVRPIPQVALKVARMLAEGGYSWAGVAEEIRRDQVLGARIIQLCNSAIMDLLVKVGSIDRAVLLLGERRLLQVAMSVAFEEFFQVGERGYSLMRGGLYRHSVGTAVLAERVAQMTKVCPPDLAYTAGLLHDIGKVVLDQHVAEFYPLFYYQAEKGNRSLIDIEREYLGTTHPEVGGLLAENWGLPVPLREAIALHYAPAKAEVNRPLVAIVYVSSLLMSQFHAGLDFGRTQGEWLVSSLEELGLPPDRLPELVQLIPQEIF